MRVKVIDKTYKDCLLTIHSTQGHSWALLMVIIFRKVNLKKKGT